MMAVTMRVNELTMAHKGSGGYEKNTTPDVCLTPPQPVPVPYSITSYTRDLIRGSVSVFADGGNSICIKGCAHKIGYGDAAGSNKGVVSGTNLHESTWITYSPNVYIEGKNICRLSDKLFMNNKNCVSASGNYEPPVDINDPIMRELCKIFCASREEWHSCKKSGAAKCDRPSTIAERKTKAELGNKNSGLNKAVKDVFPESIGRAEKRFLAALDDVSKQLFEGARKIYDPAALQRAIQRKLKIVGAKLAATKAAKVAGRWWLKAIPGLNLVSGIYDVVDIAMTGAEIYNLVKESGFIADNAIQVKPDFAVEGPNGEVQDIYDFKFDDPESGFQDDWQDKQKQREAYEEATGEKPKKVDDETCDCDKRKTGAMS